MSFEIDPKIERDLTELAVLKNMSVNALLREFTADQKRYWKEREMAVKKEQPGIDRARRRKADMERHQKENTDSGRLSAELLACSAAGEPVRVFECDAFEWNKGTRRFAPFAAGPFIKAPEVWVNEYLSKDELKNAFGEYVFWLPRPKPPVPEMPGRAVVTKGPRRIGRFKKMLLERGARFVVVQGEGPLPGADSYMGIKKKR